MVARIYPSLYDNIRPQYSPVGSDTCNASTFNACFDSAGGRVNHLHQLQVLDALYQTKLVEASTTTYDMVQYGDDALFALRATQHYSANRLLLGTWTAGATYATIATNHCSSVQNAQGKFISGSTYFYYSGSAWNSVSLVRPGTSSATRRAAFWDGSNITAAANTSGQPLIQLSPGDASAWGAGLEYNAQPLNGTSLNSIVYVPGLWIGNGYLGDVGIGVTYLSGSPGFACFIQSGGVQYFPTGISGNVGAAAITYDYRSGEFVFAARGTNRIYYSTDPTTSGTWNYLTVSGVTYITDIYAVGGVWFIIVAASDLAAGSVMISVDHGSTWQYTGLVSINRINLVDRRIAFTSLANGTYLSGVVRVK